MPQKTEPANRERDEMVPGQILRSVFVHKRGMHNIYSKNIRMKARFIFECQRMGIEGKHSASVVRWLRGNKGCV